MSFFVGGGRSQREGWVGHGEELSAMNVVGKGPKWCTAVRLDAVGHEEPMGWRRGSSRAVC